MKKKSDSHPIGIRYLKKVAKMVTTEPYETVEAIFWKSGEFQVKLGGNIPTNYFLDPKPSDEGTLSRVDEEKEYGEIHCIVNSFGSLLSDHFLLNKGHIDVGVYDELRETQESTIW